jgi:hypothetical protein
MAVLVEVNAADAGDEVGYVGGHGFGDERGGGRLRHHVDLGDAEEDERGGGRLSFNHRVGDGEEAYSEAATAQILVTRRRTGKRQR